MERAYPFAVLLVAVLLIAVGSQAVAKSERDETPPNGKIVKVLDGGVFEFIYKDSKYVVRPVGVIAPRSDYSAVLKEIRALAEFAPDDTTRKALLDSHKRYETLTKAVSRHAPEVAAILTERYKDKKVTLKYGKRMVGEDGIPYAYIRLMLRGGKSIEIDMLRNGWGVSDPTVNTARKWHEREMKEAREAGLGIWADVDTD